MIDSTKRPALPDLPTFARPPFRACEMTAKIWGRDEYGGQCMVADVRGWGYLTGLGRALGLPNGVAFAAQVKTAKFIAEAMNERAAALARIAELELLLARNLVMDLGSGEEGAEALGGIGPAMQMVAAYREANPLPKVEDIDDDF